MKTHTTRFLSAAAGLAGLIALAAPLSADAATIKVTLTDKGTSVEMVKGLGLGMGGDMSKATMAIVAKPNKVKAGKVTFEVVNASKDTIHEMLVALIADVAKPLAYLTNEERVDEEKSGDLGEVSELDPGKTGALTLDLKPGTYLLFCNVPGHYMTGMWTTITVTGGSTS